MDTVEIIDRLIAISMDSERRYRHAAKDVERVSLEEFFKWQAANRKTAADELLVERNRLAGDQKTEHGTLAGLADTAALDFSVIMSKGDTGVVEWCREDDESVIKEYNDALAQPVLPANIRSLLERQLSRIRGTIGKLEEVLSIFREPRS